jgi:hypothetical protein
MPPVKVNRVAAFELNGQFYANMSDAEMAVRKAVILDMLTEACGSSFDLDDVSEIIANRWREIKQRCDEAFAGV